MEVNAPRIMIAAAKSGSGKTLLTCALLESLKRRKICTAVFKCGPDYIDPMFHKKIIGVPSYNIDSFFSNKEQLRSLFLDNKREADISLLEGVMGLFDGLGGIKEEGSAYHIASILKTPIILVIDVHGMGRSVIPLISGFLKYDREKLICGVILNRTSKNFYETIKPVIEEELGISLFGFYPNRKDIHLKSRHLGLKMPNEIYDLKEQIGKAAECLEASVEVERIIAAAKAAEKLDYNKRVTLKHIDTVKIGIAQDDAFCFYYEDNLRLLEEAGAELMPFSPIKDKALPDGICGILLGGGYPELFAKSLSENKKMKIAVRSAINTGIPSIAECGGFMYLHEQIENTQGECYPMCGVLRGKCYDTGKLVRFGYVEIMEKQKYFLQRNASIRGHEFHYYDSTSNGDCCITVKPVSGKEGTCIHEGENYWWGFPHIYYPSCPQFAVHFVMKAKKWKENIGGLSQKH